MQGDDGVSYPSPASDTTETTLPTPSLPSASSSRRPTILSPSYLSENHMDSPLEPINHHHGDDEKTKAAAASAGGMVPSINVEMDETPTRPRRAGRSPSGGAGIGGGTGGGGGLNIRGLTLPTAGKITPATQKEDAETTDKVSELAPSPRVAAFKQALLQPSPEIPMSPAWQSFDASPSASPARRMSSSHAGVNGKTPASPGMLFPTSAAAPSPLGPRASERRFDPTPQHGIHARNLSLFFPSPGQQQQRQHNGQDVFGEELNGNEDGAGEAMPAGEERKVFGGKGGWSFGAHGPAGQSLSPDHARGSKRRGHHHKHSLSHNFFSFLDPTVTNPTLAGSPVPPSPRPSTPASTSFPASVPMPLQSSNSLLASASSPTLSPLPKKGLDPRTQLYLSFAIIEFLIGAGLWVEGQLSGWRCLAGVGYLSVFDAAGVAIRMIREGDGWRSVRRPYGTARFMTLLYFAQSLFLVFASVYIAKESIETVLLGEGAHSHGGGYGHGHGAEADHLHEDGLEDERPLPLVLLALSAATALFSGTVLQNHSKLVESIGSLFIPRTLSSSRLAKKLACLRNPFTLTVAGASAAVLVGSLSMPASSLHILDSSLSLVLTLATGALAYPSARSFALVLLQTAPPPSSAQMTSLRQSLRSIADDRRILGIGSTRVWMIASTGNDSERPGTHKSASSVDTAPSAPPSPEQPTFDRRRSSTATTKDVGNTRLSVTVTVHVNDNVADRDVLDVTKYVWNRVTAAVGEGEITIAVKRGWEGMETQ